MKTVLTIALLVVCPRLYGQNAKVFTNLARSSGLPASSITAITQDQTGFIWIGSKNGLNKYDGSKFTHYHTGNSSMVSNDITCLLTAYDGTVWIGFNSGGLLKYNPLTDDFENSSSKVFGREATIRALYQKDSSRLWAISGQRIVNVLNAAEQLNVVNSTAINSKNQYFTTMVFSEGHYWVGTNYGSLIKISEEAPDIFFSISDQDSRAVNIVFDVLTTGKNQLLVATQNNGLLTMDIVSGRFSKTAVNAEIVRALHKDYLGRIWIATDGNGLFQMDKTGSLHNYRHTYGNKTAIASNAIYCIFEDRDHNIWLGTAWDGVSIIDHRSERYNYYHSDFLGEQSAGVLSILSEQDRLWFGSDGDGLHIYPPQEGYLKELQEKLGASTYPQFIKKMNDGYYWIGTFKKGLYRVSLDDGEFFHYLNQPGKPSSISHNDVRNVVYLSEHQYLIATWGGGVNLFNSNDQEFSTFTPASDGETIPVNAVTLFPSSEKRTLVGAFGEGLFLFDHEAQTFLRLFENKVKNCISIYSNSENTWIGTWGKGLYKTTNAYDTIVQITGKELSTTATILSILPAKSGGVYITTKEGVYHINNKGRAQKLPGLNGQYHINSATLDFQGRLFFGNTNGVVSFDDDKPLPNLSNDIQLFGIKLFNRPISEKHKKGKDYQFSYNENVLTFEYGSLVYPTSSEVKYQLMVEPLNKDWVDMGSQRYITLANLNPGRYTIRFKTLEGTKIASATFNIANPWWKAWWAFLLYLMLFLLLLYSYRLHIVRLEQLRSNLSLEKLNREKEAEIGKIKQKFFINISHEIRTPLTLIIGEIEQLIKRTQASAIVAKSISNIRANSNHMLQLVNELLDFRKLESEELTLKVAKGNLIKFAKEIFLAFQVRAEEKNIQFTFKNSSDLIEAWYDRDQLEKVFYNLLSNALKYTPSGKAVELKVDVEGENILIRVSDSGRGIAKDQLANVFKRFYQTDNVVHLSDSGFGIGLSIVHDIVKLHHGQVTVESELGSGTTFTITLLCGNNHFSPDQLLNDFLDSESIKLYTISEKPVNMAFKGTVTDQKDELLLVVEDNEDIRNFIGEVLQDEFRIAKAENGLKALESIEAELPDLIISDVMMPEMDGINFVQKLKSDVQTSHIPVILLTARTGLIFMKEGYESGADEYMTKPFNASMLRTRVRNILRSRQVLREKLKTEYLTRPKVVDMNTPDEQFLIDFTRVIDKFLDSSDLDTKLVSAELGMSHSVVYKKLKALTGFTIVEFIRDYRLSQAAKLLTSYRQSVSETCYSVGFSDRKYFSQVFKKKYGMTPSEYAKFIA
ncbi:MAG: ATP-binding protein [Bacteroidota bacterium]